jgi:hypothetical protein
MPRCLLGRWVRGGQDPAGSSLDGRCLIQPSPPALSTCVSSVDVGVQPHPLATRSPAGWCRPPTLQSSQGPTGQGPAGPGRPGGWKWLSVRAGTPLPSPPAEPAGRPFEWLPRPAQTPARSWARSAGGTATPAGVTLAVQHRQFEGTAWQPWRSMRRPRPTAGSGRFQDLPVKTAISLLIYLLPEILQEKKVFQLWQMFKTCQ